MTTRDALLAEVIARPDDDLPRLVFADWLEENGDEGWAKLIRCMCRDHSRYVTCGVVRRSPTMWGWGIVKRKMVNEFAWAKVARRVARSPLSADTRVWRTTVVTLSRGFISHMSLGVSDWWNPIGPDRSCVGCRVVKSHPLERLSFPNQIYSTSWPLVSRIDSHLAGPLWPLIVNHPRYKSELSGGAVAMMDDTGELNRVMTDAAIQWAKSVTPTA